MLQISICQFFYFCLEVLIFLKAKKPQCQTGRVIFWKLLRLSENKKVLYSYPIR